ncbi:MAG TPA: 1-acyl-sn-glycerol-3-phosphate acyltransferase [Anaerolineae bacterium]|nr:1-acyl-sn-glycerol-3-phosphate acyltransferase [Anaerolineae bacterium]
MSRHDSHHELTDRPFLYRLLQRVVRMLLSILAHLEVEGLENLPPCGPYMLISNHLHWLDPPVIFAVLPARATVFAAEKWEHRPVIGQLLAWVGNAIFVRRGEVDRKALRQALNVLSSGGILGIAPEGTRSKTGGLQRGRDGPAYLAARSGVPIVPMVVSGQEKLFPSLLRWRRATVHVVVGKPFTLPESARHARSTELDVWTHHIMLSMARLLPPQYRGVYAEEVERTTNQPTGESASK